MVVDEVMAREARPLHRILTLFDHLLRRPPVVVEMTDPTRGNSSAGAFNLCDYPELSVPRRRLVHEIVV